MKETFEMVKITRKYHDRIKKFCGPLNLFGVNHFFHARVTHTSHFTGINLHPEWEEYFFSNKNHLLLWPDKCQPLKVKSNVRFLMENENDPHKELIHIAKEKYSINFSLQIVEKTNQETDIFGFALDSPNPLKHMTLLKEMPLLRLFIKRFKEEFKGLYKHLNDHQIDLKSFLGPQFYNKKISPASPSLARDCFLQKMNIKIPLPLSNREIEVIRYLIQGYSASQIGLNLYISKRTVEHHLERIKEKFDSSNKAELIRIIRELESIGFFMF